MGPPHHAIEDYGVLLTLPNMAVYTPVFDDDMAAVIARAGQCARPCYIRMGRGEQPENYPVPAYAPYRQLTRGDGALVLAVGPLASTYIDGFDELPVERRPNRRIDDQGKIQNQGCQIKQRDAQQHTGEQAQEKAVKGSLVLEHQLEEYVAQEKRHQHGDEQSGCDRRRC